MLRTRLTERMGIRHPILLAPMGSGALWARRELLEAMPPFLSGGEMIREVHLRRSDFNEIPWKFEAGTPAVGDAIGLGVAAEYLGDADFATSMSQPVIVTIEDIGRQT